MHSEMRINKIDPYMVHTTNLQSNYCSLANAEKDVHGR